MKKLILILGIALQLTARAELRQQNPSEPSCQRSTNLVMVHGFNSSAETWARWVELLRADTSLSCINLYTFSYKTGYTLPQPSLDELGAELRAALSGLAASGELVLMAHSMGGLVVKKALLQDLSAPTFLPQLQQVFFVASPHSGIRRPFAFFAGIKSPQVKALRHPKVRKLRRQWRQATEALPSALSFSVVVGTKDSLVPRYSAKGGFEDVLILPKDHVSVKDPDSTEGPLYQKVKTALLASLI
jgi:triacylglycerol esterase/lipase EstA (alpha/beta hydrolase family)